MRRLPIEFSKIGQPAGFGSGLQSAVLAAEVKKRLACGELRGFHFAQKDGVISRQVFRNDIAGEVRQSILEDGDARSGPTIADAEARIGIGALFACCKMPGEGLLRIIENAYTEAALGF